MSTSRGARTEAAGALAPPALVEGDKSALLIKWFVLKKLGQGIFKSTSLPSKYHKAIEIVHITLGSFLKVWPLFIMISVSDFSKSIFVAKAQHPATSSKLLLLFSVK